MQNNSRQHRIFARHPFYRDPNTIMMWARSCKLSCPSLLRAKLPSREPDSTGGIAFASTRTLDHQRPTANARRLQIRLNWLRMSLVATARYAVNISFIHYRISSFRVNLDELGGMTQFLDSDECLCLSRFPCIFYAFSAALPVLSKSIFATATFIRKEIMINDVLGPNKRPN